MDFKVIISQPAITDLRDIVTYIANHNPTAAERLGMALIQQTRKLASFPEMGRQAPEILDSTVREIVFRSYRIFTGQQSQPVGGNHPLLACRPSFPVIPRD